MDGRERKLLNEDIEVLNKIGEMKKILISIPEHKLSTQSRFVIKAELEKIEATLKEWVNIHQD